MKRGQSRRSSMAPKRAAPERLDPVYDERRKLQGLQPNGYIWAVTRNAGEIELIVKFHDSPGHFNYTEEDFSGRGKLGQWMIYADDNSSQTAASTGEGK